VPLPDEIGRERARRAGEAVPVDPLAEGPEAAFRLEEVPGVAVVFAPAKGRKCARSWRISEDVGSDPEFPDLSPRDAKAVRELDARAAEV